MPIIGMRNRFVALALLAMATAAAAEPTVATLSGGARWAAEVPANWNGTLLLWSRGYSPAPGDPQIAARDMRETLLDAGYALAGSDYGAGGWALAEAVPAQRATVAAFAARHGKPRRVIGWGSSMGGLVTSALAEERRPAIDAALALCASIGGAVGMMNMALDGAFAFRTLVAPEAELVRIGDDRANGKRVADAAARAAGTPEGLARIALAGVLGGLPGWTTPGSAAPAADDAAAQAREMAKVIAAGLFLPRQDQEARSSGIFSWNRGVDYRRQLDRSGRRAMVAALYAQAGLDLDADLARLNREAAITADKPAVTYMLNHYTPNGRPNVPLLAVQAVGDGMTSPSLQRAYLEAARGRDVQGLWVNQAGHCNFSRETLLAALRHLETRMNGKAWPARPAGFVDHKPPPMLRPCVRGGQCR